MLGMKRKLLINLRKWGKQVKLSRSTMLIIIKREETNRRRNADRRRNGIPNASKRTRKSSVLTSIFSSRRKQRRRINITASRVLTNHRLPTFCILLVPSTRVLKRHKIHSVVELQQQNVFYVSLILSTNVGDPPVSTYH